MEKVKSVPCKSSPGRKGGSPSEEEYIYYVTSEHMGFIKLGRTKNDMDLLEKRYDTVYPNATYATFPVGLDSRKPEKELFKLLIDYRIGASETFKCTVKQAQEACELISDRYSMSSKKRVDHRLYLVKYKNSNIIYSLSDNGKAEPLFSMNDIFRLMGLDDHQTVYDRFVDTVVNDITSNGGNIDIDKLEGKFNIWLKENYPSLILEDKIKVEGDGIPMGLPPQLKTIYNEYTKGVLITLIERMRTSGVKKVSVNMGSVEDDEEAKDKKGLISRLFSR